MRTTILRGLGAACLLICGIAASAAADTTPDTTPDTTSDAAPKAASDVTVEKNRSAASTEAEGRRDHTVGEVSPVALATSMTDDDTLAEHEDVARLALGSVGPRAVPATLEGTTEADIAGSSDDERREHYIAAIEVEEETDELSNDADDDTANDAGNNEEASSIEDDEGSGEATDTDETDAADNADEVDDAETDEADEEPAEPVYEAADGEGITAERIETFLDGRDAPLRDHAATFVEAGVDHDVDPRVVVGIAVAESSAGEALPPGTHNAWGWGGNGPQGLASWGSWDESIDAYTERLGALYDTDNVGEDFARTYCPPNWRWWLDTVTWVIDEI